MMIKNQIWSLLQSGALQSKNRVIPNECNELILSGNIPGVALLMILLLLIVTTAPKSDDAKNNSGAITGITNVTNIIIELAPRATGTTLVIGRFCLKSIVMLLSVLAL